MRRYGLGRLPLTRSALDLVGMLPVRHYYHEPAIDPRDLRHPLDAERRLPALELRVAEQLEVISRFHFAEELTRIPLETEKPLTFSYRNGAFEFGDAELLYDMIRHFMPRRIVEIGSGFSTLIAREAIAQNNRDDPRYACTHICVEPFEKPWLENTGASVIRQRVEEIGVDLFHQLEERACDSTHQLVLRLIGRSLWATTPRAENQQRDLKRVRQ